MHVHILLRTHIYIYIIYVFICGHQMYVMLSRLIDMLRGRGGIINYYIDDGEEKKTGDDHRWRTHVCVRVW